MLALELTPCSGWVWTCLLPIRGWPLEEARRGNRTLLPVYGADPWTQFFLYIAPLSQFLWISWFFFFPLAFQYPSLSCFSHVRVLAVSWFPGPGCFWARNCSCGLIQFYFNLHSVGWPGSPWLVLIPKPWIGVDHLCLHCHLCLLTIFPWGVLSSMPPSTFYLYVAWLLAQHGNMQLPCQNAPSIMILLEEEMWKYWGLS